MPTSSWLTRSLLPFSVSFTPAISGCIPILPIVSAWPIVTISSHRVFIVLPCSDNGISSTLSTSCFPQCSKLATISECGLVRDSAPQNFSSLHQHIRFLKRRKETLFTSRVIYNWWLKGIVLFAHIFVLLFEKLRGLVTNAMFVMWMTLQFEWAKHWLLPVYFTLDNMHWAGSSWLHSSHWEEKIHAWYSHHPSSTF